MNMQEIYEEIARINDVSIEEVKAEMEKAVNTAYAEEKDAVAKTLRQYVPREGEVPTSEEFISYLTQQFHRPRDF